MNPRALHRRPSRATYAHRPPSRACISRRICMGTYRLCGPGANDVAHAVTVGEPDETDAPPGGADGSELPTPPSGGASVELAAAPCGRTAAFDGRASFV